VRYEEALAAEINKPGDGSKAAETTDGASSAPPGAKPAGRAERRTKAMIKIKAVDLTKNTLSFIGSRGMAHTVAVEDPALREFLKQLKPGDEVEVTYREAMAISIEPGRR